MLWGTSLDASVILLLIGVTLFLAYFVSLQLSRSEQHRVRVRGGLKLSIALIVVGAERLHAFWELSELDNCKGTGPEDRSAKQCREVRLQRGKPRKDAKWSRCHG